MQRENNDLAIIFMDFKVNDQRGDNGDSRLSIAGFAKRDGVSTQRGFNLGRGFADHPAIGSRHPKFGEPRFGRGLPDDCELHR